MGARSCWHRGLSSCTYRANASRSTTSSSRHALVRASANAASNGAALFRPPFVGDPRRTTENQVPLQRGFRVERVLHDGLDHLIRLRQRVQQFGLGLRRARRAALLGLALLSFSREGWVLEQSDGGRGVARARGRPRDARAGLAHHVVHARESDVGVERVRGEPRVVQAPGARRVEVSAEAFPRVGRLRRGIRVEGELESHERVRRVRGAARGIRWAVAGDAVAPKRRAAAGGDVRECHRARRNARVGGDDSSRTDLDGDVFPSFLQSETTKFV